ncbi:AN1-type zinc finger protein 4 [Ciona intestinalis]
MNDKEFFDEGGNIHSSYRLSYNVMELFIETLTGTCFELRVSPYETVIAVKAKIQRLEGIPVSQQFLIWKNVELEDECCLRDYNITDGCTLKLVLAMRGGPINTRRVISMEESRDLPDPLDNPEDLFDKPTTPHSGGNGTKQVTLLVYRDGDQLNFFRVVDRGDGTLTPFSESLSGSACNLHEEEEEEIALPSSKPSALSVAQMVENNITASKMKQLRTNMENLMIAPQPNKVTSVMKPKPPSMPRKLDGSTMKRYSQQPKPLKFKPPTPATHAEPQNKNRTSEMMRSLSNEDAPTTVNEPRHSRLRCFRNVTETNNDLPTSEKKVSEDLKETNRAPTNAQDATEGSGRFSPRTRRLLNALESDSYQRRSYLMPRPRQLSGMTYNRHDMYLRSYGLLPSPDQLPPMPTNLEPPSPRNQEEVDMATKVFETNQGVKYSTLDGYPIPPYWAGGGNGVLKSPIWEQGQPVADGCKGGKSVAGKLATTQRSSAEGGAFGFTIPESPIRKLEDQGARSKLSKSALRSRRFTPEPPKTMEQKPTRHRKLVRGQNVSGLPPTTRNDEPTTPLRQSYKKNNSIKESHARVETMSKQEAREVVDFINKAVDANVLRNLVRSPTKDNQRGSSGQSGHRLPSSSIHYTDKHQPMKSPHGSAYMRLAPSCTSPTAVRPPSILPPVKHTSKKKRCFLCGKRTGLATSYTCRCGNNFCASHRYAEAHDCTYDYKTAGRKILKEANPLVSAPKLPKI